MSWMLGELEQKQGSSKFTHPDIPTHRLRASRVVRLIISATPCGVVGRVPDWYLGMGEPPKVIHRAVTGARGSRTGSRCSGDPQVLN